MTEVTDEQMRATLAQAKAYTVAILTSGPMKDRPDRAAIVWEHGRRNMALRAEGALPIVCPIRDDSSVHGIGIFARTVEETKAILDDDPGVRAGVFRYELHACMGFPGSALS
ncbi:MAG TPA: hypothetical protein VF218_15785 [Acidothermaceae bacterium]|jgi:hypothetical protein